MYFVFICCGFFFGNFPVHFAKGESAFDANVRLEKMLLTNYTKEVRPVNDVRDNVTITVGVSLYLIKKMDDKYQMITLSLWIRQVWHDPRFVWTPTKFSNVTAIHLPAKQIWIPDIKIYNEVHRGYYSGLDQFQTRVIVGHDGKVQWMGPIVLRTSCQVNIKMFPFDTQTCKMKIGSWTYDGFALDVKPESYTMDVSKSPSNLEWELISTSVDRNVQVYPCCPEPYPDVTYTITIKRRQQSYAVNYIIPALFLTALTGMAFVTSGERIGLVLTCLVSMFFFLKMVAEMTPSSETVPLLSIYFVVLSFEIALTFYAVCVSMNAHHKHPALSDMSGFVRALVIEKLGRIWGMDSVANEMKEKLKSLQNIAELAKSKYEEDSIGNTVCDEQQKPGNVELTRVEIEGTSLEGNESERHNFEMRSDPVPNRFISTRIPCEQYQSNVKGSSSNFFEGKPPITNSKPKYLIDQSSCKVLNVQSSQKQTLHFCECETCKTKAANNRCSSFLNEIIALNQRLLSSIQEINFLARTWDHKASHKKHWLIAASILDRTFFISLVLVFIVYTLYNFLNVR